MKGLVLTKIVIRCIAFSIAIINAGLVLAQDPQIESLIDQAVRSTEQVDTSNDVLSTIAELYLQNGNIQKATNLVDTNPQIYQGAKQLILCEIDQGRLDHAMVLYHRWVLRGAKPLVDSGYSPILDEWAVAKFRSDVPALFLWVDQFNDPQTRKNIADNFVARLGSQIPFATRLELAQKYNPNRISRYYYEHGLSLVASSRFSEAVAIANQLENTFADRDLANSLRADVAKKMYEVGQQKEGQALALELSERFGGYLNLLSHVGLLDRVITNGAAVKPDLEMEEAVGIHWRNHSLWRLLRTLPENRVSDRLQIHAALSPPRYRAFATDSFVQKEKQTGTWSCAPQALEAGIASLFEIQDPDHQARATKKLIALLCRLDDVQRAEQLLPLVDTTQVYAIEDARTQIAAAWIRQADLTKAWTYLRRCEGINFPHYRPVIDALVTERRFADLEKLLKDVSNDANVRRDTVSYAVQKLFVEDWQLGLELGEKYSNRTRQHYLASYAYLSVKQQSEIAAYDLLEEIRRRGVAGLDGWCQAMIEMGRLEGVEAVIDEMPIVPGSGSRDNLFHNLAVAFCKIGEYRKAETLALKRQRNQQVTLATVLRSLVGQGENSKADEMLSRYAQQDERHQSLLIVYAQALLEKK